jgi:chromosome segregation ATPase
MSASVEIVFDNADSRFPVDKEEVRNAIIIFGIFHKIAHLYAFSF